MNQFLSFSTAECNLDCGLDGVCDNSEGGGGGGAGGGVGNARCMCPFGKAGKACIDGKLI